MTFDATLGEAAPAADESRAAPVAREARIADIDVIRGMALFGVLMCNLAFCFRVPLGTGGGPRVPGLNEWVCWFEITFLSDKAMTLFSMLFGAGLTIFLERASARGPGAVWLLGRRLFFLALFGVAHHLLLWNGDILIPYATAGYCSLFFLRKRPRVLLLAIAGLSAFPLAGMAWPALQAAADGWRRFGGHAEAVHVYGTGTYLEIVRYRMYELVHFSWRGYIFYWPGILRNMLIGILIWRSGLFRAPQKHVRVLRWVAPIGVLAGLAFPLYRWIYFALYHPAADAPSKWRTLLGELSAPTIALGYGAGILLLLHGTTRWRTWLGAFAPLGRMAFTNYLTQTVVCTTIFYGYGLGLSGQVGYAPAALMGIVLYGIQMVVSPLWLRRFRFGPFEWAWRSLTYGKWQSMVPFGASRRPSVAR